jgi:endonuclease YncB( thermonuclease family)
MRTLVAALELSIASPAFSQTIVDGDTIKLNGTTYRFWGIDASETKQWCGDYPAGVLATGMLVKLTKGKTITCEDRGLDRFGRTIGLCRAAGADLDTLMVQRCQCLSIVHVNRTAPRRYPKWVVVSPNSQMTGCAALLPSKMSLTQRSERSAGAGRPVRT